jgi:hypothetical protein
VFRDNAHVMNVVSRIVSSVGRRIDESSPMVDARLPDGSRVNAIIPPLALNGPTITIRKFSKNPYTGNDLLRFSSVSPKMLAFLEACVKGRLNSSYREERARQDHPAQRAVRINSDHERIVTIETQPSFSCARAMSSLWKAGRPIWKTPRQVTIRDSCAQRAAYASRPHQLS